VATLHISLLGEFEARLGTGEVLALKGRKTQALVAYLALAPGERRTRDELIALLWGDRGEQQARSSLRQSLSELRKSLGDAGDSLLVAERDAVSLDADAIDVDVTEFKRLIDDGTPTALERAAELYRGELLDGIGVHDAAFEDWLREARGRLSERACEALSRLLDHQAAEDSERAIATARRLLALDPLRESTHRVLMRLYAEAGDRPMAIKQYHACRDVLAAELGLLPEPETEELAEEIRIGAAGTGEPVHLAPEPQAPGVEPLPLPDNPSIAVLPFANMSADPEQEFFSDGITEDIITALSKVDRLLVVARNSTFTYKGQAVDVKQVSREQGVRYVLEGSVRKAGDRVRVTTQLIDATTGHHLWAERYDRDLEDIFAVQDEITREVVVALDIRLRGGEQARIWSGGTRNLEAWECVRRSTDVLDQATPESVRECLRLCERALELDPNYAMAWVMLGWTYHQGVDVGLGHASEEGREAALGLAFDCARRTLELDPSCANAYCLLSFCHLSNGEYDEAIAMSQKAVALAPNHADILALSATVQNKSGRPERSLELIKKAMRLCPVYPGWYFLVLGTAYRLTGQAESAISALEAAIKKSPDFLALHVGLASTLGELGREEDAKKPVSEILRIDPEFSIKTYMAGLSYSDPVVLARFEDGLRKVGLPE
jgi:TolB-like protein/Tfp pilus assembly protein PilF